jgi:[ribosomal protein S5]-alanine N-acetyltransferase
MYAAILETSRLLLRGFLPSDASRVRELAGDYEIAKTTLNIPWPYPEGVAETWIESLADRYEKQQDMTWALTLRGDCNIIGAISLMNVSTRHLHAELGYWVGKPYWNKGYCTEAGRGVIGFAFGNLRLNRIFASHFVSNMASCKVMTKLGMAPEGIQRSHVERFGEWKDLEMHGVLRTDKQPDSARNDSHSC